MKLLILFGLNFIFIVIDEESRPKLNFNTIIYQYVRKLANNKASSTAFQYLILLYLYETRQSDSGRCQIELCHFYVRQLVYDTEAFSELVGDVRSREVRTFYLTTYKIMTLRANIFQIRVK